jgi:PKD repeat protein
MPDDGFSSLGVMVTPVKQSGVSPFSVTFQITSSLLAKKYVIDFGDGNHDEGTLVNGQANVKHTYLYAKSEKYSGTTYLPTVTVTGENGEYPTSTQKGAFYVMISAPDQ